MWYSTRVTAYGAVPGFTPAPFGDGVSLDQSRASHNRPIDRTGLAWMGARYYDLSANRFISTDPLGFAGGSYDLYAAYGGVPTFFTDRDARAVVQAWQQAQVDLIQQGGAWNWTKAIGISAMYSGLTLFSFGSFNQNDRLVDRNLAGEISDRQLYGGMAINSGSAFASLYTGGAAGTFTAGRMIAAGSRPLTGMLVSGGAAGFTASVTDISGRRGGYAATGIDYEQTIDQDLKSVAFSTALGASFGGLTYAGMRGEGIVYSRTDGSGHVDPYFGTGKKPREVPGAAERARK